MAKSSANVAEGALVTSTAVAERILVSVATYNERENLEALIREIHQYLPAADVLVTDDNSPDGTGRVGDDLAAKDPRIHVIHRAGKLGLGTAILGAIRYGLDQNYDLIVNMDADFSHHPRYLPALIAGMRGRDVMIGSRYVPGGGSENWPWSRRMMSKGVNVVSRLMMRLPAQDTSGSYRCYRATKLRQARLDRMISRGYSFQQELLYRCRQAGSVIGETPIMFENRRAGTTKVNTKEVVRSMGVIVWIGILALFGVE